MAGLGETCSHVGALLFAIETAVRIRDSRTVTDDKSYWLPPSLGKVTGRPIHEIDFTSSRSKKKRLDCCVDGNAGTPQRTKQVAKEIPGPSESELSKFFSSVFDSGAKPALLSSMPGFAQHYKPKALDVKYPMVLSELEDDMFSSCNPQVVVEHCKDLFHRITVTAKEATVVEECTRDQASNREWHRFRIGRITASRAKAVCRTSMEKPSHSLIRAICYPNTSIFSTKATRWGCEHESVAINEYHTKMKEHHENFEIRDCGLVLHPKYPYLGATPDAIASCSCCGEICVEVKCPYCAKDSKLIEYAGEQPSSCLEMYEGQLRLDRSHQYYYQVQCQLLVCEKEYCDLIVWTQRDCHMERIACDEAVCSEVINKGKNFFINIILPELVGKTFSHTAKNLGTDS